MQQTEIKSGFEDRIGFFFIIACILHAILIMGISFNSLQSSVTKQSLEVTLATFKTKTPQKDANYLAQFNQEGSGTIAKKATPSSNLPAPFQDRVIQDVSLYYPSGSTVPQAINKDIVHATISEDKRNQEKNNPNPEINEGENYQKLRQKIASLEAVLHKQQQIYAQRPTVKRLNSATTKKTPGALYMESWREKVVAIGNAHYPQEIRRKKIYGDLELAVRIKRDGSLDQVDVIRSSGYPLLDQATIDIVKMAAPFQPFPDELKKNDILEIIRTWKFEKGTISSN